MSHSHQSDAHTNDAGGGPARVAHHFDSARQQYDSAKLGMWIFLVTEILFFSGLFCFYAVYRANHPADFVDGHRFLDKPLGAANTVVLLFSSLTMALAVRAAQLGRRGPLVALLAITVACGVGFLGVKTIEYKAKWDHRLVPGQERIEHWWTDAPGPAPRKEFRPDLPYVREHLAEAGSPDLSDNELAARVRNIRSFMAIYFALTGLHAIHVLAGLGVILWILVGSARGRYGSANFTPVDMVGLYWHLVDLIWIYLFPLLYLIH
ncbi:MAG TPA: cytochrome c oxidase subunit 3 family protein [Thermoguttaceae bacterium]|nr:cytochrome c oxidase subunit 3 family protein [Thermoguttaceae bacterium]